MKAKKDRSRNASVVRLRRQLADLDPRMKDLQRQSGLLARDLEEVDQRSQAQVAFSAQILNSRETMLENRLLDGILDSWGSLQENSDQLIFPNR